MKNTAWKRVIYTSHSSLPEMVSVWVSGGKTEDGNLHNNEVSFWRISVKFSKTGGDGERNGEIDWKFMEMEMLLNRCGYKTSIMVMMVQNKMKSRSKGGCGKDPVFTFCCHHKRNVKFRKSHKMTKRKMMNVLSAGPMFIDVMLFLDSTKERREKSHKTRRMFSELPEAKKKDDEKLKITRIRKAKNVVAT